MKSYDTHIHAIPWNCNYNVDLTITTSQQSQWLHQKENFQFISFEILFLQHLEDVWEQAYISDQSLVSSLGQFFIYKTGNMKSTQLFSHILQTRQWIQKLVTSFNMTINKNSRMFRWHLRNVSCTNIHVIHHVCCHYFKTQHSTARFCILTENHRLICYSRKTQELTFLHFYKLNSMIKTLFFLDLSLDNRVRF